MYRARTQALQAQLVSRILCERAEHGTLYAQLDEWHSLCFHHPHLLFACEQAACFFCRCTYTVAEIEQWTDDGGTALCPRCSIDAVLPTLHCDLFGELGLLLNAMHEAFFDSQQTTPEALPSSLAASSEDQSTQVRGRDLQLLSAGGRQHGSFISARSPDFFSSLTLDPPPSLASPLPTTIFAPPLSLYARPLNLTQLDGNRVLRMRSPLNSLTCTLIRLKLNI